MRKAIYVAATCFQLITNLNIRCNMHGPEGDLIINADSVPDAHGLAERLKKYNVFENIFIFSGYDTSFKSVFNGRNTLYSYLKLVVSKHCGKVNMNDFLEGDKKINLLDYDESFCFNKRYCDIFVSYGIKINIIDEGLGSYLEKSFRNINLINKIYIYSPKIADYYEKYRHKIEKLEMLNPSNKQFKDMLNYLFCYKSIDIQDGDAIFLDQPYKEIPRYIIKLGKILPFFRVTKGYKKYFIEEEKVLFIEKIIKYISYKKNIFVKPHPRDGENQLKRYKDNHISIISETRVPWEVILLNILDKDIYLFSFDSTATLSAPLYFSCKNKGSTSIFLYKIFLIGEKDFYKIDYSYMDELLKRIIKYKKGIIVLENIKELYKIIG